MAEKKYVGLRPCPFCKGQAKRASCKYSGRLIGVSTGADGMPAGGIYEELRWYAVKCTKCGVSQPKRTYHSREESDEAWNRRA